MTEGQKTTYMANNCDSLARHFSDILTNKVPLCISSSFLLSLGTDEKKEKRGIQNALVTTKITLLQANHMPFGPVQKIILTYYFQTSPDD